MSATTAASSTSFLRFLSSTFRPPFFTFSFFFEYIPPNVFHKIYAYFHPLYKRIIVNETEDMINAQTKGIGIQILFRTFGFATFDNLVSRYQENFYKHYFYIFIIGYYSYIS